MATATATSAASIASEGLISLADAARLFPTPRPPHERSVWRWATVGQRGVRLWTKCVAGRRFTTAEAVERFIAETDALRQDATRPRSVAGEQRAERIRRAKARCAAHGA